MKLNVVRAAGGSTGASGRPLVPLLVIGLVALVAVGAFTAGSVLHPSAVTGQETVRPSALRASDAPRVAHASIDVEATDVPAADDSSEDSTDTAGDTTDTAGDTDAAGDPAARAESQTNGAPDRTVDAGLAYKVESTRSGNCSADAPTGWRLSTNQTSSTADLVSGDGGDYAGYGIVAVNTSLARWASAYQAPLNDPNLYSTHPSTVALAYARIVDSNLGGAGDVRYTDDLSATIGGYSIVSVRGSQHRGAVIYRTNGYPGDGVNESFILPIYFAYTSANASDEEMLLVLRIAASIRCSTQFQPPKDYFQVEARTGGSGSRTADDGSGYNVQLGTEYVTDKSTGENYVVSPASDWSNTGPDGPGYYVYKGNSYVKLDPGRS